LSREIADMALKIGSLVGFGQLVEAIVNLQFVEHTGAVTGTEIGVSRLLTWRLARTHKAGFETCDLGWPRLRKKPDAGDDQWLVNEVESEAMAPGKFKRARRVEKLSLCQPRQDAGSLCELRCRHASQHCPEPWKEWNVVVRPGRDG
jgi:hypothetical protein